MGSHANRGLGLARGGGGGVKLGRLAPGEQDGEGGGVGVFILCGAVAAIVDGVGVGPGLQKSEGRGGDVALL